MSTAAPETIGPYKRPCLFCILYRPGCAPNLVTVQVQNSDGICEVCDGIMRAKAGLKSRVLACEGPTGPCILPAYHPGDHIRPEQS